MIGKLKRSESFLHFSVTQENLNFNTFKLLNISFVVK